MKHTRTLLLGLFLVAGTSGCDAVDDLLGVDETGTYGQVEIYSKTSTSWTDRLPDSAPLTDNEDSSSGSGIGAAGTNPESGLIVMVANVDPDSPCAAVGQTCAPVEGASTMVTVTLASPDGGIAQWIAVDGEVTVESINPTRFRLENVQMRVAPYDGNPANGSFNLRGVVGVSN